MERTAPLDVIAASLRRERERHGISLAELARRAGVAKSTLSQLEAGVGNPSIETLWALAVALDVPFSSLVDPPEEPIQIIRAGEGAVIRSEQAPFAAVLLFWRGTGVNPAERKIQFTGYGSRAMSHV